ncbi:MAG: heme ABC exporter ATP-binding protein CcmA [Alphaproteobacteria bacterium]|nr:heme ABC exporter ATP-binding protein CcmA [Alphaproteobacteria bacterium]
MEQTDFTIGARVRLRGQNIGCARAGRPIFEDVTFTLTNGDIVTIIGANGSGKTSLLRIIAGLLPMTDGQFIWEVENAPKRQNTAKSQQGAPPQKGRQQGISTICHFIAHQNAVKGQLQVCENLAFWAHWFGAPMNITRLDALLERVGLLEQADILASDLSVGQAKRLALARLFIVPRALWLLDEPLAGLDEEGRQWLEEIARTHLAQGGLICVATHERLSLPSTILKLDSGTRDPHKRQRDHV